MNEAIFALCGAIIGALGILATEWLRAKRDASGAKLVNIRNASGEFLAQVSRFRDLTHQLRHEPRNKPVAEEARDCHIRVRAAHHMLGLTSESVRTQEQRGG